MRVPTAVTLALTAVLATLVVGAVVAVPSGAAPSHGSEPTGADGPSLEESSPSAHRTPSSLGQPQVSAQQSSPPPADPEQIVRINVTASGDAEWTIESRFLLTDDWDAETFDEWAGAVVAGERPAGYDRQTFQPHVRTASEATGREMTLENATWNEPRIESVHEVADDDPDGEVEVGVISYSFVWTNFATADDNRVYVGDAFESSTGLWLSTLADGQQLVVQSPPHYGFDDYNLPVSPEGGALILDGPYEFADDDLEVVFLRGANGTTVDDSFLPESAQLFGGVALLVVAVGAGGYLLARRDAGFGDLPALSARVPWSGDEPPDAPAAEGEATSTADPTGAEQLAYEEDVDDVDPELLSDEERVCRLLRKNGGRMKQGSIVTETGWSNAKVSQLLSKMDDDGEIEKLRIGRENLITLPEIDPTEVD